MRTTLATLAVSAGLICASCVTNIESPSDEDDSPQQDETTTSAFEPSDDTTPTALLALASDETEPRETLSFSQAQDALANDPDLGELRHALTSAGWSPDESAGLVTAAAGHNSGAEHDEVRGRNLDANAEISAAFAEFEEELALAEAEAGITVDRDELFAAYFSAEVVR